MGEITESRLVREFAETIKAMHLSEEEIHDALIEAKIKKYFHLKNKEYWDKLERGCVADRH